VLVITLGAIAAFVVRFTDSVEPPAVSDLFRLSQPVATRDSAIAEAAPHTPSLTPTVSTLTEQDAVLPVLHDNGGTATVVAPSVGADATSVSVEAAPVAVASSSQLAGDFSADADDFAERPIGWCFRTWIGHIGTWLATSPPGEPMHALRTEWREVAHGAYSAWLGSEAPPNRGFNADVMWQTIDATPYRGSRVELSGQFRGNASLVHLFFRPQLASYAELGLSGTQEPLNTLFSVTVDGWWRMAVVGDVPADAEVIVLGVAVYNRGHAWIDDLRITKLDARAAPTTPPTNNPLHGERFALPLANVDPFAAPTNLDFEATEFDSAGC
jgi:hypothetical protein